MEVPIPTGGNAQSDQAVTAAVVKNFLFKAFRYRVEQVLAGKRAPTGWPQEVDELEGIAVRRRFGRQQPV